MLRKIEGDKYGFFREPHDEEPAAIVERHNGAWAIRGHEDKQTFANPEMAEPYMGIASAFDYMPLLLRPSVPALYYHDEHEVEMVAQIKLFATWSYWTWYICEAVYHPGSGQPPVPVHETPWSQGGLRMGSPDVECFGYVVGTHPEYGYFSLAELAEIRGPMGLRIERDLFFTPTPMSKLLV